MSWAFAVFLLAAMACAEAPVEHIVLVTLGSHRADGIGASGSPAGHTPNFDHIAAHSAISEHAVTPVGTRCRRTPACSRACIHGVRSSRLGGIEPALLEELRGLGYVE